MSTDTPRTDAQGYGDGRHPYVPTEFARQLERELQERAESWRMSSVCRAKEAVIARLELELAAERALADRLCASLERHAWLDGHETPNESEEAIAAWKEARHEP